MMSQGGGNHNPSSSRRPIINNPYAASNNNNNNNNNRNTGNRQQQQAYHQNDTAYHHPMAEAAPVPPPQPAAEPMALDPIGTNNTNLEESTTTIAVDDVAANDLKEQLKALRQELMAQSEANFELNATIATMQAEMTHTIQTSEQKHKQEASKLNHLLRLEQLKSQQLEQQQQQQQQQQQYHQRKKQRASMDSVFSKRPLGGSIPTPPQITTTTAPANHPLPTESPVSPTPPPITTTTTTTTFKNQQEATRRLAQQLLQTTTDTSSQQQQYPNQIRQVLMDIIAIRKNHSSSSLFVWNEVQLVEYLLRETKQQEGALEFCTIALQQCRPARMAIQKAIITTTTAETTTFSATPTTSQPETTTTTTRTSKSSNRIRPLQSPPNNNNNKNEAFSSSSSQEIATTRQMVLTALQDPWWNDDDDDDSVLPLSLGNLDATTTTTTTIPSPLVKDWVRRLIIIDNDSTTTAARMNRVVGLQALHVLLTEQSYYKDHSQTEWWNLCHSSLEQVLEQIHSRQFQKTTISTTTTSNNTRTELHHSSRMTKPTTKIPPFRRLQVATNENYNDNDDDNDETIHEILARSLSIFAQLIQITQIPLLEKWYSSNDEEGHDGRGGSRMVSLVLDLLEAHSHADGSSSRTDEKKQPAPRTIIQRPDMEGWYIDAIRFLSVVGSTYAGMVILRTRTRPAVPTDTTSSMTNSGDGVWMGNALDVAIRQLFTLVMDQEEQSIAEQETDGDRIRTLAIEGWVRLWHQVLLFVQQQQQQQQPDKQPPAVDISFRSLVLEHQNWYTSACAMLLTNDSTRPEIQSMIRLQLEELSMDEEEYEELKEQ